MTEELNTNYLGVTPGIANYIEQEVGDVDLSEYYTKNEIDSKIDSIEAGGESSIRQGVGENETRFRSFHPPPHLGIHYFIMATYK